MERGASKEIERSIPLHRGNVELGVSRRWLIVGRAVRPDGVVVVASTSTTSRIFRTGPSVIDEAPELAGKRVGVPPHLIR